MPDEILRPGEPSPRVAAQRRAILIALVIVFAASTVFILSRLGAQPAWLRPFFLCAEFLSLGIVIWIVRRHWKREDEIDRRP